MKENIWNYYVPRALEKRSKERAHFLVLRPFLSWDKKTPLSFIDSFCNDYSFRMLIENLYHDITVIPGNLEIMSIVIKKKKVLNNDLNGFVTDFKNRHFIVGTDYVISTKRNTKNGSILEVEVFPMEHKKAS